MRNRRKRHLGYRLMALLLCAILLFSAGGASVEAASQQSSFEKAWQQFVEEEMKPNSNLRQTIIELIEEYTDKVKELGILTPAQSFAYGGVNKMAQAAAFQMLVKDFMELENYQSPHKHALFRWADIAFHGISVFADAWAMLWPTEGGLIAAGYQFMGFGYDYIDTPEVSDVLNQADNLPIQIVDLAMVTFLEAPLTFLHTVFRHRKDNPGLLQPFFFWRDVKQSLWDLYDRNFSNRVPAWVNAYKPNIYLYGDAGTELDVVFGQEELLTRVIPEYEGGWHVVIGEDGTLTVDGKDGYPYLFYESRARAEDMQTETGFLIEAGDREAQLRSMLESYQFNETEIRDFLEYWTVKLDAGKDFIAYPQTTEIVDRAMPLTLGGKHVDSYTRIWFYFLEADGEMPEPPEAEPVAHEGTALVEWGGVLAE